MTLEVTLKPEHYLEGLKRIESINEDPLGIAIKATLGDYECPRDMLAIGESEIFLSYKKVNYLSPFDNYKFYRTKPNYIKLEFKVLPHGKFFLEDTL